MHEIADRAVRADNSRHAILRLHANAARASIALDTLPKVFRLGFPNEPLKRHRSEGYFSLRNGSEIWIGGLDDQDRVEKILGKEYATIFLNECSQIPYASVLVALTRLAQVVENLPQAAYYDLNPTNKGHWTNLLFGDKRDPISRQRLADPDDYARMFLNPGDNAGNLSAAYLKSLENLPERQRKRFFEGVYVDDLDGALFSYEVIARARVDEFALARCHRVVVAVDPSGAAGRDDERADEIGIVVAAKGDDGHAYVLADRSLRDAPAAWGRAAVQAYHEFDADRIIAEENFGGEMVRFVIRAADANAGAGDLRLTRQGFARRAGIGALRAGPGASRRPICRARRSALRLHHGRLSRRGQSRPRRRAGLRRHRTDAEGERSDHRILSAADGSPGAGPPRFGRNSCRHSSGCAAEGAHWHIGRARNFRYLLRRSRRGLCCRQC